MFFEFSSYKIRTFYFNLHLKNKILFEIKCAFNSQNVNACEACSCARARAKTHTRTHSKWKCPRPSLQHLASLRPNILLRLGQGRASCKGLIAIHPWTYGSRSTMAGCRVLPPVPRRCVNGRKGRGNVCGAARCRRVPKVKHFHINTISTNGRQNRPLDVAVVRWQQQ